MQVNFEFPDVNITELCKPLALLRTLSLGVKCDQAMITEEEVIPDFEIFIGASISSIVSYKIISMQLGVCDIVES